MNRHRFDADPDPDATIHFDPADSDLDPDLCPTPKFTHVGKSKFFVCDFFPALPVYIVLLKLVSNFSIFWIVY